MIISEIMLTEIVTVILPGGGGGGWPGVYIGPIAPAVNLWVTYTDFQTTGDGYWAWFNPDTGTIVVLVREVPSGGASALVQMASPVTQVLTTPALTDYVNVVPDAQGFVGWDFSGADPLAEWSQDPYNRWFRNHEVLPDDGIIGSAFLRLGSSDFNWTGSVEDDLATTHPRLFFHHYDNNLLARYKFRLGYDLGWTDIVDIGVGLGTWYCGEPAYSGLWTVPYGESGGTAHYGLYEDQDTADPLAIKDISLGWNWVTPPRSPANFSHDGSQTFTGSFPSWPLSNAGWPVTLMFQSPWQRGYLDIGAVRVRGTPMWGACDILNWYRWQLVDCGYAGGPEGGSLGGLVGHSLATFDHFPSLGYLYFHQGYQHAPGSWSARSPKIQQSAGYGYDKLYWQSYNEGAAGHVRIYVRNADDGSLLPDNQVPGNSTGQASPASAGWMAPAYAADLSGVPGNVHIFLDVQGVNATAGDAGTVPRLGGVWVSFRQL